jgi:hypothetical protein
MALGSSLPIVVDRIEIDRGDDVEALPGADLRQSRCSGTGAGGVDLFVGHGEEEQIALALGEFGEGFEHCKAGGEPGFHVEEAAAGDVVRAGEIFQGQLLGAGDGALAQADQQAFLEVGGAARERLQIAVILDRHGVEMAGEDDGAPALATHQSRDAATLMAAAGHRDGPDVFRVLLEGRRLAQQLAQSLREGGFFGAAADARQLGHLERPIFGAVGPGLQRRLQIVCRLHANPPLICPRD